MNIALLSVWGVGAANGYSLTTPYKLSDSVKYGTMALATGVQIAKSIANLNTINTHPPLSAGQKILSVFLFAPIGVGLTFCLGTYVGKSWNHARRCGL